MSPRDPLGVWLAVFGLLTGLGCWSCHQDQRSAGLASTGSALAAQESCLSLSLEGGPVQPPGNLVVVLGGETLAGLQKAELFLDGSSVKRWAQPPLGGAVDASTWAPGYHRLKLVAWANDDKAHEVETWVYIQKAEDLGDLTAPILAGFLVPWDGSTVCGTLKVQAAFLDSGSLGGMRFLLDGAPLGDILGSPYQLIWDTSGTRDGKHLLTVEAFDMGGNSLKTSISVTVNNKLASCDLPPGLVITTPADQDFVNSLGISFQAADDKAVVAVRFLVDGVLVGTKTSLSSPSFSWNPPNTVEGPHVLALEAQDSIGQITTRQVTVNYNKPPVLGILTPGYDQLCSGMAVFQAQAQDGDGVASVTLSIPALNLNTPLPAPDYKTSVDVSSLKTGSNYFEVTAKDSKGMTTTSSSRFKTSRQELLVPSPYLEFISPNAGDTVAGPLWVKLKVKHADCDFACSAELYRDGVLLAAKRGSRAELAEPWALVVPKAGATSMTLKARLQTLAGQSAECSITVSVTQPRAGLEFWTCDANDSCKLLPELTLLTEPCELEIKPVAGSSPLASVAVQLDGEDFGLATTAPFKVPLNPVSAGPGAHRITARAVDAAGLEREAQTWVRVVCDLDGDGHDRVACGGDDCDDSKILVTTALDCDARDCGSDNCGGSCGTCPEPETCSPTGFCSADANPKGFLRRPALGGNNWVSLPGGTFDMGDRGYPYCVAATPVHKVTLGPFEILETEVTEGHYEAIIGPPPSPAPLGAAFPVDRVTWDQARAFCEAIGGDLPTEAQWEYAARGGMAVCNPGQIAECPKFAGGQLVLCVAGSYFNAFGLYDMVANANEWTNDYHGPYPVDAQLNPQGPQEGTQRVARGRPFDSQCSYDLNDNCWVMGVQYRDPKAPDYTAKGLGFRCARVLP